MITAQGKRQRSTVYAVALFFLALSGASTPAADFFWGGGVGAAQPVGEMNSSFGASPTATVFGGVRGGSLDYRLGLHYAALMDDGSSSITNFGALVVDGIIPHAFGIDRLSLIGGAGFGGRKLSEGRLVENPADISSTITAGVDDPVYSIVGRLGVGYELWRSSAWRISAEAFYQSAYSVITPDAIGPDTVPDETIQFTISISSSPRVTHP